MVKTISTACFLTALIGAVAAFAAPSRADAETLAGLQLEIGSQVDALVRDDVRQALDETMEGLTSWSWVSVTEARGRMNPVVRDCFTNDCLMKAGAATGAEAGVRVAFSGESQIYDWTIEVYDLRDGSRLSSQKGACELCGRAEVLREFRQSLQQVVAATSLPKAATPSRVATPPDESPPPAQPREWATTTTPTRHAPADDVADDPTIDLVMVEISVQPADAEIVLDGQTLGTGHATVSLEHGSHELQFRREEYRGFRETLSLGPQSPRRLTMRVHMSRTDPEPVEVGRAEGPVDRLGAQRTTYGVIGLAMGGALLVTGAWLSYLDGRPACSTGPVSECPDVYATAGMGFAAAVVGTAAVTSGAALLAWEVLAGDGDDGSARLAPGVSADGVGVVLFGRF